MSENQKQSVEGWMERFDDARWNLQLYKKIMAVLTTPTKEDKTV